MLKGFYLTLLVGPVVAAPAPKALVDSLTSVQVTNSAGSRSGFQLTFTLSINSPLHTYFLLSGGGMVPLFRVIIVVTVNGTPSVLIDGVMTNFQVAPSNEPGMSTLTVTGEDLSAVMDWIDFTGIPYPALPAEARVALIVAKYAMFGLIPLVVPSILIDVPIPVEEIPRHQGTDLEYVKKLADDVGYVFFVAPGPVPGSSFAYWGPDLKIGEPQPALNTNMDASTNVESLSFTFDSQQKTLPVLFIQNLLTKVPIPIPVPDVTPLNPPLGLVPPIPRRLEFIEGTAALSPIQAALIGLAKASKSSDAVSGSGSLDVLYYGQPLKARGLVGVRGAGPAFDGLHYVTSVTHNIKRGEYKQSFSLVRNGLVSTLPRVPV
jgi:hypothetical protein